VNKKKPTPTASSESKSHKKSPLPAAKSVAENRKARHEYQILESVECGLVLRGTEVKSLRTGKCSLDESYGRVKDGELWLVGCDIPEYKQALYWNHEPKRPRKLLLHRREMNRFVGKTKEKGLTLIPLKLYFNERGLAKCSLALCKGLQSHDKRQVLKKNDARREMERAVRRRLP
jgi:SsrA-binding protein